MINTRKDYLAYLEADRLSLRRIKSLKTSLFDEVWKFQRLMRRLEYFTNCKKNKFVRLLIAYLYKKQGFKLGFTIPINVFGPGLSIAHSGTIVINGASRIGANCRIHVCVNIGTEAGKNSDAPTIGDNCYIGPGAKIFGKIKIGDNVVIGANAVVNKSFEEGNATIAGVPAKIISKKTSEGLLCKGYLINHSYVVEPELDKICSDAD
jgi:serine O-acetyltransferase